MSGIIPIPTTRVGDYFVRQRLVNQVQRDQLALFQLQNQISTGNRLQLPSDDAPAALRAIRLQRLLDRKDQIRTNLQASNFYLGAAETNLGVVSQQLSELRAAALSVADTVATPEQRQTVIHQIEHTLRLLVDSANAESQGRYLFSGSKSQTQPYDIVDGLVRYRGNEGSLRSYVELARLFETNLSGPEVFGGISAGMEGTRDLQPHLTADTLVSTLNRGQGISPHPAIEISVDNGTSKASRVVDLRSAVTIRDVARLLESGAPDGTDVRVDISGQWLVLTSSSGTISITEVGQGRTAHELGIATDPNAPPANKIVGGNLRPAVLKTTPLANLLGTKAYGMIPSANSNNDIILTANSNGAALNGITVEFINGASAGSETAVYDAGTQTLTVTIQPNVTTANQAIAAINAEGTFTATLDHHDSLSASHAGTGSVQALTVISATAGGSGEVLDTASGLAISNGKEAVIDVSAAKTVEDLLNQINGAGLGLLAEINAEATGINIRSRLSGANLTIGENGGTTATQLGVRTYTGDTQLAAMNRGLGVPTALEPANDDLLITARNGTQLAINLSSAKTVQDVIDLINGHPANAGTTSVVARLARSGNGIELVDSSAGATGNLTVANVEGSRAAEYLGFTPIGQSQTVSSTSDGSGNDLLQTEDRHTLETDSVFNTLLRLREAIENGDVTEIGRSLDRLDEDMNRINFARSEIGARLQNLEVMGVRLEDENVQLQSSLSQDLEVDLVEAISNMTARQYAFEASLRTAASVMQLSLLNFI